MLTEVSSEVPSFHPTGADPDALPIMALLHQDRLSCRIITEALIEDVRLEVRDPTGAVTAELLLPAPGCPGGSVWHAVRVDGLRREVWRGPERGCHVAELVTFLHDVIELSGDLLARRYRLLG